MSVVFYVSSDGELRWYCSECRADAVVTEGKISPEDLLVVTLYLLQRHPPSVHDH